MRHHPTPTRKIARQATSAAAYPGEAPDDSDPLLSFTPVPHAAPRRNSITPDLQRRFIAELAATGIVTQAARSIGKSMEALYKLRQRPGADGFRAAWDMAIDRGIARLEDCALARALEGEERPIISGGKLLGTWTRQNNALLMFLLRQRRPDRYAALDRDGAGLRPGNPAYERIKAEVLAEKTAEDAQRAEENREEFEAMLQVMHQRVIAARTLQFGAEGDDGGTDA